MKKDPYIVFGAPCIGEEETRAVIKTLRSRWIGTGPQAAELEKSVAKYAGAKFGRAVNSGTAALHLALVAHGIGKGDEVITTPLTFCASANVILHAGATPVFVDVERETMNIDPKKIEKAITKRTKAILPVHMTGRPCEMDAILKLARRHKLIVIEDAAHAIGASYKGKMIGGLSDATCFSFYTTKNITTAEGGMLTTNKEAIAQKVKVLSLHGISKDAWKRFSKEGYRHYEAVAPGYKYNLTDIAAAMGVVQMKKIQKMQKRREEVWRAYDRAFKDLPVTRPAPTPSHMKHARHLYTLLIDKKECGMSRDEFMQALHERGIGSGVHFIPVHRHKYYREAFGFKKGDFPNAEYVGERTVSLPLSGCLKEGEVARIVKAVREIVNPKKYAQ